MAKLIKRTGKDGGARKGAPVRRSSKSKTNLLSATKAALDASNDFNPAEDEIEAMLPSGLARTFVQSQLRNAKHQIEAHGLEVPEDYDGDFPQLPDDIETVDYAELSNIMLKLQNAHATAIWQQSFHYVWQDTFKEIADYLEAVATTNAEGPNEPVRRAKARTEDRVVFFKARHKEHYHSYVRFRDLAGTIDGKIKAVSRVLGFKDEEESSADLSAIKKRGTSKRARSK